MVDIRTVNDLIAAVDATGSYFFSPDSMKFFGDTRSNYKLRSKNGKPVAVFVNTRKQANIKCYALERRKPVKHGLKTTAYFNMDTFERVRPAPDNQE